MWLIPEKAKTALSEEGFVVSEDVLSKEGLAGILKDLDAWKNVPAINGYGCLYHSDDAVLQN